MSNLYLFRQNIPLILSFSFGAFGYSQSVTAKISEEEKIIGTAISVTEAN